jgi:hypothetical protein
MKDNTSITDKIDGVIFDLPFEDKIKCWELIEKLIDERIKEFHLSDVSSSVCGNCIHYEDCKDLLPPSTPACRIFKRQTDC